MLSWIKNTIYPSQEKNFKTRFSQRLELEKINVEELYQKLKETGSIIAGSYPLQVYLGESWEELKFLF